MKNWTNHINLILILLSIILIVMKVCDLRNALKKNATILRIMKNNDEVLSKSVRSCELIGETKNRKPSYDNLPKNNIEYPKGKYWTLKNNIEKSNNKLMMLCSHTSMVIDKYKIFKDQVSNKVCLGMYEYPLIICDSHTLSFNETELPYKSNLLFKVYKKEKINIEYKKYILNHELGTIDTISKKRTIERNTLYNNR